MKITSNGKLTTAAMTGHSSSSSRKDYREYVPQEGDNHPMQKGWMLGMKNYATMMGERKEIHAIIDKDIGLEAEGSVQWAKRTAEEIRGWIDLLKESNDRKSAGRLRKRLVVLLLEVGRTRRKAEVLVEDARKEEELAKRSGKEWAQFAKDIWVIGRPSKF